MTEKREDGFHNLETIFYPVPLFDALESITTHGGNPRLSISGTAIPGDIHQNLCFRAYHLLKQDFPDLPAVDLYLHKRIPTGAGLGGGSADAAFTLRLLNTQFRLNLSRQQLHEYAFRLGSDCPFFMQDQPCFASGRGEILEPIAFSLAGYQLLIVNPAIHISTPWAFQQIKPQQHRPDLRTLILQAPETWKSVITNDFETPVMEAYPLLRDIRTKLEDAGAAYVSMSGSGSSFFGLFSAGQKLSLQWPPGYFSATIPLEQK